MSRKTGQITHCGGKRRKLGSLKRTGRWTNTGYRLMPSSSSHLSTSCFAFSCPTWSTSRWKSTSQTGSSRRFLTSAKRSVSNKCRKLPVSSRRWGAHRLVWLLPVLQHVCSSHNLIKWMLFSSFQHPTVTWASSSLGKHCFSLANLNFLCVNT